MNHSTDNVNSGDTVRRSMDDALAPGNPEAVDHLIADVLGRAHREAEDLHALDEARAILKVAHSFADELATTDPRFDRLRFIRSVGHGGSVMSTRSTGRSSMPHAQQRPAPGSKRA